MIFWICLIIGGLFAWLGLKKGLYCMVAALFNLMVGIYVSVLAAPVILSMSPEYSDSGYYAAITIFVLTAFIFAALQTFAWFYFLRDAEDYFPKLIDQLAGIAGGFFLGYFVAGWVFLLMTIMPFSRGSIPFFLPQREKMQSFASASVVKVCNFIGEYSLECFDGEPEAAVNYLVNLPENAKPSGVPAKPL
ncbi:MAG: CvpA family protein [Anaerohalosphaeraceae bacterium]